MARLLVEGWGWHSALSDSGDLREQPLASLPHGGELGFLTTPQRVAEMGPASPVAQLWASAVTGIPGGAGPPNASTPHRVLGSFPTRPLTEGLLPA